MEAAKVQLIRADLKKHKTELTKFLVAHFSNNPLNTLLPVPECDLAEFFIDTVGYGNLTLLAFYEDELVGCRTGNILSYETYHAVSYHMFSCSIISCLDDEDAFAMGSLAREL